MSIDPFKPADKGMSLSKAWLYYLCSVVALFILGFILYELDIVVATLIPYILLGIYLNRTVLRYLVKYHPIYDTLSNVSNTKLAAIIAWPFFYLTILIKLAIVKYL